MTDVNLNRIKLNRAVFARLYSAFTWVLLAMESHDVHTGLAFEYELVPPDKGEKLRQACLARQLRVIVPNPEPYQYLVHTWNVRGRKRTFRAIRGVVVEGAS